jgi:hypothetical protein
VQIPEIFMSYDASIALEVLAYLFWKEKEEDLVETQHGPFIMTETALVACWIFIIIGMSITGVAFVSGFVHEEEFVIPVVAAGHSIDPALLIIA